MRLPPRLQVTPSRARFRLFALQRQPETRLRSCWFGMRCAKARATSSAFAQDGPCARRFVIPCSRKSLQRFAEAEAPGAKARDAVHSTAVTASAVLGIPPYRRDIAATGDQARGPAKRRRYEVGQEVAVLQIRNERRSVGRKAAPVGVPAGAPARKAAPAGDRSSARQVAEVRAAVTSPISRARRGVRRASGCRASRRRERGGSRPFFG